MKRTTFIRTTSALAAVLLALVLARTFVGNVYHVRSGSMEPTIFGLEGGGEWVFVRYDRTPPRRNELVVVLPTGDGDPLVKRVAGLPFERVQIVDGDLWIDDRVLRRAPTDAPPRPFVTVFDSRWQPIEGVFHMGSTQRDPWSQVGDDWRVDATGVPTGNDEGMMYLVPRLDDAYLGPDHERVVGQTTVNDAVVECDVLAEAPRGRIRLQLTEQGDTFELSLAPLPSGEAVMLLTRRFLGDRLERLEGQLLPRFATGVWHRLRFANVDNELTFELDGAPTPLRHVYAQNERHPADLFREGKSLGARVLLGGEGGAFRFRSVRIERDLYYTPLGRHGTSEPEELGPDQYFLLGDNSAHSSDSRTWGPVTSARIVGRAVAVVWPPARWRRLDRPVED